MPNKTIMPLRQFNLGDGRVGNPGVPVDVPDHVAHAAHSFGNARILTDEEAAAAAKEAPGGGDEDAPTSQDRDPRVRKR
jgi:hypothetical protein